jgi:hypothetical protein
MRARAIMRLKEWCLDGVFLVDRMCQLRKLTSEKRSVLCKKVVQMWTYSASLLGRRNFSKCRTKPTLSIAKVWFCVVVIGSSNTMMRLSSIWSPPLLAVI